MDMKKTTFLYESQHFFKTISHLHCALLWREMTSLTFVSLLPQCIFSPG